jgi:enoyl-CoA hydratase/carnithine racemase
MSGGHWGTYETFTVDDDGGRLLVTLARPEKLNAIGAEMIGELHALLERLEAEPRVVILTGGADGVFAAGADIGQLLERRRDDALQGINLRLFERLRATPLPTIAAIDGHALGGGAELAYACDLRIATPRSTFGQPEARLGIMAAAGGAYRLKELVGESLAKDLLFTGRRIDAEKALSAGLLSSVVEPEELLETAERMTASMLKSSAIALRLTKLAVNAPPGAHPAVELAGQAILFEDEEKLRRMGEFVARRRES